MVHCGFPGFDAAEEPRVGAGDGGAGVVVGGACGDAVVEGHDDIGTNVNLGLGS